MGINIGVLLRDEMRCDAFARYGCNTQLDMGGRRSTEWSPPPPLLMAGAWNWIWDPGVVRSWLGRLDGRNRFVGAGGMFQIMENAKVADWMGSGVTQSISEERKGDYGHLATAERVC